MDRFFRCLRPVVRPLPLVLAALLAGCAGPGGRPVAAGDGAAPLQVADNAGDLVVEGTSELTAPAGDYLAGLVAERHYDLASAVTFFSRALAAAPDNGELLQQTFVAALSAGRFNLAVEVGQRIVAVEPGHPLAEIVLALDLMKKGDTAGARQHLDALSDRGLSGISGPLLRAWAAVAAGDRQAAVAASAVLEREAGFAPLARLHRALMLDVLGDKAAGESYQAALDALPEPSVRAAWFAGNFFERNGEPDKAAALYGSADGQATADLTGVLARAQARMASGEAPTPPVADAEAGTAVALLDIASLLSREQALGLALMHGQLALAADPELAMARLLVGELLQRLDQPAEAIAAFRRVPADSPFGWSARLQIAENLDALDRTEEAVAELEALAAERPDSFEPLYRLGNLLRSKERFVEAADAYDRAVARLGPAQPEHWSIYYFRGIAFERAKQWPRAEADLLKALELRPEQPHVMNYLAYSWVEQGEHLDRALKMLERAVELQPEDGFITDSLGWVYYRLERYAEAVGHLERAVELEPMDPVVNDHLGDAYWRMGRTREARVQWRRALSLEPEADRIAPIEEKIERGLPAEAKRI